MKKIIIMLIAVLGYTAVSAQTTNTVKQTDNNVKIPNEDIIRLSAQRPRDANTSVTNTVTNTRDTIRRANATTRVNTNINANTVNENSNGIKVDVSGQAKGTVASPIGSEPVGTQTATPRSAAPKN